MGLNQTPRSPTPACGAKVRAKTDEDIHGGKESIHHDAARNARKPKPVDPIDTIDVLFPHERSPDASGQKRSCAMMMALSDDAPARHIDRPCEKKLKHCHEDRTVEPMTLRRLRHPERVLSPLDVADADQIRQHLCDVRREVFLRPMIAIVTRLMFHKYNHGMFNVRVDPIEWNIPHYLEIVKNPMDLTLVKTKCLNLEYATADECAADIKLVFSNACLFNPVGHVVHECAKLLMKEFEVEYARYLAKCDAQTKRREEHSCPSCLANICGICNEKCINFEPPLVMCSGPCQQRIKRHAVYYQTPDRTQFWCAKCHTGLPRMVSYKKTGSEEDIKLSKQELVKAKFIDELTEPWVQCDDCSGWVHQICALFNACENADADDEDVPYTCPLCRLKQLEALETSKSSWSMIDNTPSETSVDEFPIKLCPDPLALLGSNKKQLPARDVARTLGVDSDVQKRVLDFLLDDEVDAVTAAAAMADHPSLDTSCISSAKLMSCALSTFMQTWVCQRLREMDESTVADSIVIKVASSIQTTGTVSPVVREHMRSSCLEYPDHIEYTSKAIFVFQKIHGVEVCIFSMYVQEYDGNAELEVNRKRVYIAYIDSLVYMRPRHVRTRLFHEILISYLGFSKVRGYEYAHIWACPTTRGGDFIYWCHPSFQKNPGKDRLLQWYTAMAAKAKTAGVAFSCEDLYTTDFEALEDRLEQHLPPYFDGDYWPAEVERLHANPPKRGKLTKEVYEENRRGARFRKRLIESVRLSRESLFVIALQPKCGECSRLIVNESFWKAPAHDDNVERSLCESCRRTDGSIELVKVEPPSFVQDCNMADDVAITCPFLDHRADMLKNCEERHYQFDSFRRAKYSTMMLIYHISTSQRITPLP